jgi:hypothetical protein
MVKNVKMIPSENEAISFIFNNASGSQKDKMLSKLKSTAQHITIFFKSGISKIK